MYWLTAAASAYLGWREDSPCTAASALVHVPPSVQLGSYPVRSPRTPCLRLAGRRLIQEVTTSVISPSTTLDNFDETNLRHKRSHHIDAILAAQTVMVCKHIHVHVYESPHRQLSRLGLCQRLSLECMQMHPAKGMFRAQTRAGCKPPAPARLAGLQHQPQPAPQGSQTSQRQLMPMATRALAP